MTEPVDSVRIARSAIWAALGDALGFISELTDEVGLHRRIGGRVETTVPWRRRVGGRFGADIALPAGCYSDDTQLRLATARAIRGDGTFDVEAFAKVELPVWLSYGLGGGRGTKAAAQNLLRREVTWNTNFFKSGGARYILGGGNGAAMRIQPHVWAAPTALADEALLLDVLRNAVVTHGHPLGLIGAAAHALTLRLTLRAKAVPAPTHLENLVATLRKIPEIMAADDSFRSMWLPLWEQAAGKPFADEFNKGLDEYQRDVEIAMAVVRDKHNSAGTYEQLVKRLGAFEHDRRGTGTTTAILASTLAWQFAAEPKQGLLVAANLIGSDTDTIGSMAGAILGVVAPSLPPDPICDRHYIIWEATRLHAASTREQERKLSFAYPDLVLWEAPRTQSDAVTVADGTWHLAGFGALQPLNEASSIVNNALWQWFKLNVGENHHQLLLLKRRAGLEAAARRASNTVVRSRAAEGQFTLWLDEAVGAGKSHLMFQAARAHTEAVQTGGLNDLVPQLVKTVVASNFDPKTVGDALMLFLDAPDGFEAAMLFASEIRRARKR